MTCHAPYCDVDHIERDSLNYRKINLNNWEPECLRIGINRELTLSKVVDDFQLTIVKGERFLPEISPFNPTSLLKDILKETLS